MNHYEASRMSLIDWACLGIFILGFVLFLVGANTYDVIVGYTGIFLLIGAIAAYLVIYIYKEAVKKTSSQNP
jgi:membrane-bound ClpP family serine protease